jgi:hypothetical protein
MKSTWWQAIATPVQGLSVAGWEGSVPGVVPLVAIEARRRAAQSVHPLHVAPS